MDPMLTTSLIDLANIPGNELSGVDTETYNWVTEESNSRYIHELSRDFEQMLQSDEGELFANSLLNDEITAELNELERSCIPKSSQKQMDSTINRFKTFLKANNLSDDLLHIPSKVLNDYLRFFYSRLRKQDGTFYTSSSLVCIRAAIHRFFALNRPSINIITNEEFSQSNRMLKSMVAKYKTSGQAKPAESFPAIQTEDMKAIRAYFDRSNFKILQQEIIFNMIYFFGLRGRETLPLLSKESVICEIDSNGSRYLRISHDLLTKNSKCSLQQKEYEDIKKSRAYENKEMPQECPVLAWDMYYNAIGDSKNLFPKPSSDKLRKSHTPFCSSQPLSKHSIDNLMPKLSVQLNLSRRYTNHCIRVTMVTVLKENGYSNTDISTLTGHKNPMSVERYSRKRRDIEFEAMGKALHLGSTSQNVTIQTISKKSKIITVSDSIQNEDEANQRRMAIHFNGQFSNCNFYLPNQQ